MARAPLATEPPALRRFSVFLSYASDDRPAARLLRDALQAAGLDVWYDENELGGGDAWDQKIRNQIRDCDYFLPVVSATTERRREGYFRREWRLATERTLDMADDVLFLVPVVIDDTPEAGARVPERFLSVQWLRVPGGRPNDGLAQLCQRLLAGDHRSAAASRAAPRTNAPQAEPASAEPAAAAGAIPMPPFPPRPADPRDNLHYLAQVFWWLINATRLLFKRLPKAIRILLVVWLAIVFLGRCSESDSADRQPSASGSAKTKDAAPPAVEPDTAEQLRNAAQKLDQVAADQAASPIGAGFARAGAEIARAVSTEMAKGGAGSAVLAIAPFALAVEDLIEAEAAEDIFDTVFAQLALSRPGLARALPLAGDRLPPDGALTAIAMQGGQAYVLVARVNPAGATTRQLEVRLLASATGESAWAATYPWPVTDPAAVQGGIVEGVLRTLPKP